MTTKESILLESLKLFATNGYEAVSVRDIAGKMNMTQAALYKHYKNKQDIFDQIVLQMREDYTTKSQTWGIPEGTMTEMAQQYQMISLDMIRKISKEQFLYWAQDEYASLFRKLLLLEQFRNKEMADLYQQYMGSGVIEYMSMLFQQMMEVGVFKQGNASLLAIEFYSPIYMLMSMYENAEQKEDILQLIDQHIIQFSKKNEKERL